MQGLSISDVKQSGQPGAEENVDPLRAALCAGAWLRVWKGAPQRGYSPLQTEADLARVAVVGVDALLEFAINETSPAVAREIQGELVDEANQDAAFFTRLYVALGMQLISEESVVNAALLLRVADLIFDCGATEKVGFRNALIQRCCRKMKLDDDNSGSDARDRFVRAAERIFSEVFASLEFSRQQAA